MRDKDRTQKRLLPMGAEGRREEYGVSAGVEGTPARSAIDFLARGTRTARTIAAKKQDRGDTMRSGKKNARKASANR